MGTTSDKKSTLITVKIVGTPTEQNLADLEEFRQALSVGVDLGIL